MEGFLALRRESSLIRNFGFFQECAVTGRLYTFEQIYNYSRGFAAGLLKRGVQRGEMVAVILPNIPEYPICIFGTFDAGCRLSTVNPAYTARKFENIQVKVHLVAL